MVFTRSRLVLSMLAALCATFHGRAALAADPAYAVGMRELRLVDASRPIKPSGPFAGTPDRRIDTLVWYPAKGGAQEPDKRDAPAAKGGPWPLVIYSHGTWGHADNAMHIVRHLVRHGYVVAAPNYPLASRNAFTRLERADIGEAAAQVGDIRFVIDRLLADRTLAPLIDPEKIGTTGHSLGGVMSYFASFGTNVRDPRIKATAPIAAGDPLVAALWQDMGFAGTGHSAVSVPVLFLSADRDMFVRPTGRPHAAFSRVETPKYELTIKGGNHVWFHDGAEKAVDGINPDCLFFGGKADAARNPACMEGPLIDPAVQQEIARAALLDFFDGYLKGQNEARVRLEALGRRPDTELLVEE